MTGIIEDQSVSSPDSEKFDITNSLKTSVTSSQETPSVIEHYVEGEYQPPPFSYNYSSIQQSLPAETPSIVQHYVKGEYQPPPFSYSYSSIQQSLPAETPSIVQRYVKGEYQPPPFSYGYSSSQQSLPAETNREIPSTDNLISETPNIIPEVPMESEAPMHKTNDIVENIAAEELPEQVIEEKGKGRGVDFVPPFTAWNPAR
jgi:hypothetical protein